jgi:hypothetical protein
MLISFFMTVIKNTQKWRIKALFSGLFLGDLVGFCLWYAVLFARKAAHGQ